MIALLQRVASSSVTVSGIKISYIGKGVLILLGIRKDDTSKDVDYLISKLVSLKFFTEGDNHFVQTLRQLGGEILLVSQFTLYADLRKGSKPSFSDAMNGKDAKPLYLEFGHKLQAKGFSVKYGKFGVLMQVELVNDGPVTLILTSDQLKDKT